LSLRSLRGRLAVLLGLAFLPAGAVAVQAGMAAEAERRGAIQQSIGADELASLNGLRDEVVQMRELARSLAANADLFADNRARCQVTLERIGQDYPDPTVLAVLDGQARVVCADQRAFVGAQVNASPLITAAASRRDVVVGFVDGAPDTFVAVAGVQPLDQGLYVSITRPAEQLLARAVGRVPRNYNFIVDGAGSVLSSHGIDVSSDESARVRELLTETSLDDLASARRVGDTWLIAAPLEAGSLYIVHGWVEPEPAWGDHLRGAWTLLAPILLWLAAVCAAWYAIEIFVARPLFIVERLARAYARGEEREDDEEILRNAPVEMRNLRRTLAALAKTLRGREARITEALQEERVLLREVHHRVKNNLQMVASILSIQARSAEDEAEARGLARAKDRVQMLAIAHARIYASGEVRDIPLDQLAGDIARQLISARGAAASQLRLDIQLDPVRTDVDRAVAFAFLIGEGVSNAIDMALASGSNAIQMALKVEHDGSLRFEVSSPQTGSAADAAPAAQRLIDAFAKQLGAEVVREPGDPIFTRIIVPPETEQPAVASAAD
jgi:two-component sensor histidine kinase